MHLPSTAAKRELMLAGPQTTPQAAPAPHRTCITLAAPLVPSGRSRWRRSSTTCWSRWRAAATLPAAPTQVCPLRPLCSLRPCCARIIACHPPACCIQAQAQAQPHRSRVVQHQPLPFLPTPCCPDPADLALTQHMLYSPLTDCVHMTGGTATHDAIVWGGSPAEQARRRAASDPLLKVRLPAAELLRITPSWRRAMAGLHGWVTGGALQAGGFPCRTLAIPRPRDRCPARTALPCAVRLFLRRLTPSTGWAALQPGRPNIHPTPTASLPANRPGLQPRCPSPASWAA